MQTHFQQTLTANWPSRPKPAMQPAAAPTKDARPWPYAPDAAALLTAVNTALYHYIGIRATGSTPALGGPSASIANPRMTDAGGFMLAAGAAESFWPNARQFEIVGSDLEYKDADKGTASNALPPGMTRQRESTVIAAFTVTDKPAPAAPPAPTPANDPDYQGPEQPHAQLVAAEIAEDREDADTDE
jgi:hypothetical protein